jgi:hypothetical protein
LATIATMQPLAYPLLMCPAVNGKTNDQTGGSDMDSINRIFFAGALISAAAAAVLASGCGATGASSMQRAAPRIDVSWHVRRGVAAPSEIGHAVASNP